MRMEHVSMLDFIEPGDHVPLEHFLRKMTVSLDLAPVNEIKLLV